MAKSKSQERREAAQKAAEGTTPGWKENQQKQTSAKDQSDRDVEQGTAKGVKVLMKTDYRDVAKAGQTVEFDAEKAAELVRLGRAEYVKNPKAAKEEVKEEETETPETETTQETSTETTDSQENAE